MDIRSVYRTPRKQKQA